MNQPAISFIVGFLLGNILNLVELIFIGRIMKDIRIMLKQFKEEGKQDKWLR